VAEERDEYRIDAGPLYDRAYERLRDPSGDAAFYRSLAREQGGPVLELGCGSGRVLLPIAREGIACVGLDASRAMLEAFRQKDPPSNLLLVHGRMESFDLSPERFRLIYSAFRALQHLVAVDDQLACLAGVRRHLAPGGLFAFDVFAPKLDRIAAEDEPEAEDVRFPLDGDEVVRFVRLHRDRAAQTQDVTFRYERRRDGRVVDSREAVARMRYFFRYELEHLLARSGFTRVEFLGGFDGRPYDYVSGETVVLASAD
jgi:SAM-dependent methyltransferase